MRPTWRSTLVLVVAAVVLFVVASSGGFWKSGPVWLGVIGTFGMFICLLLLIVSGLYALILRMRRQDEPAA
jgi:uncharacterized membrane protein